MSLETKPGSKWWYARPLIDGKRTLIKLGIRIRGNRPVSPSRIGDTEYEKSKATAEAKMKEVLTRLRDSANAAALLEKIHEIRTGIVVEDIPISELAMKYGSGVDRSKPLSTRWTKQIDSVLKEFTKFCASRKPPVTKMHRVSSTLAKEFGLAEASIGRTPNAYNNRRGILHAVFEELGPKAGITINPFKSVTKKERQDTVIHRIPFSTEQIEKIKQAIENDDFVRPIIIMALCTAMRRAGCCTVQYRHIEWEQRQISVRAAKGGDFVRIPIFPLLENELIPRLKLPGKAPDDYVFPEQAISFQKNPDGITEKVKAALVRAGFSDKIGNEAKAISAKRKVGIRRASLRGTHSFRTTWITLALMHGISVEDVRRVTGHKIVDVVLENYFHPSDELRRQVMMNRLPGCLTGIQAAKLDPLEDVKSVIRAMTSENLEAAKNEALRLLNLK